MEKANENKLNKKGVDDRSNKSSMLIYFVYSNSSVYDIRSKKMQLNDINNQDSNILYIDYIQYIITIYFF